MSPTTCAHVLPDGSPCTNAPGTGGKFCQRCLGKRSVIARREAKAKRVLLGLAAPPPLSTPAEIRHYLERQAALVENSDADSVDRASAAVKIAQAAAALLKDELEKRVEEFEELLNAHPEIARKMRSV